jgi:hypothetical protein
MNTNDERSEFERRAAALLRDSAENLDGATRARLTRARAAALEPAPRNRAWLDFRYLAPAGAVAAAVLATALILGPGRQATPVNDATTSALYDMDLLADADAFEIAQESDLDFIEWAAAQGDLDGAGG